MERDYYEDVENPEEDDFLKVAKEQLKRVEHLVYVTLKYTRTVDVLINVLLRMIEAYDASINALLMIQGVNNDDLSKIPVLEKVKKIEEKNDDPQIKENMEIYLLIRKIVKSKNIEKHHEYRRPVALTTLIQGEEVKVNIDLVTNYYAVLMSFYKLIETLSKNKDNE